MPSKDSRPSYQTWEAAENVLAQLQSFGVKLKSQKVEGYVDTRIIDALIKNGTIAELQRKYGKPRQIFPLRTRHYCHPSPIDERNVRMSEVIGVAWFTDEPTYRRALAIFADADNMPATFEEWKALVGRQCEEIKASGNIALRADIDPETFPDWCTAHGFIANSQARSAFANHVELEYHITGKGTIIE